MPFPCLGGRAWASSHDAASHKTCKLQSCKLSDCFSGAGKRCPLPGEVWRLRFPKSRVVKLQQLGTFVTLVSGLPAQTGQCHITLLPKPGEVCAGLSPQEKVLGHQHHPHPPEVFSWPRRCGPPSQPGFFSVKPLPCPACLSLRTDKNRVPSCSLGHQCRLLLVRGVGFKYLLGWNCSWQKPSACH